MGIKFVIVDRKSPSEGWGIWHMEELRGRRKTGREEKKTKEDKRRQKERIAIDDGS